MKGFIVYPTYETIENKTIVYFYGRLENKESFVVIKHLKPYFFIKKEDLKKAQENIKKYKTEVKETDFLTFKKQETLKLISENQEIQNKLSKELHELGLETFEADIKPYNRIIIDENISGSIEISGDYELGEKVTRIYKNPEIRPIDFKPKLKILSLDIESG